MLYVPSHGPMMVSLFCGLNGMMGKGLRVCVPIFAKVRREPDRGVDDPGAFVSVQKWNGVDNSGRFQAIIDLLRENSRPTLRQLMQAVK